MTKANLANKLYEPVVVAVIAILVFIVPSWTALHLSVFVGYMIYRKKGLLVAFALSGLTILLVYADNHIDGNQDYFRAVVWSFQQVLMLHLLKFEKRSG